MTLQSERVIWAACASGELPARITTGKLKRYLIAPEDLRRWIDNMSAPVTPKEARQ
jgi:hypothetical protein